MKKNIAFTGGGTGGHIYPCLAVIEELVSRDPSQKIFYIANSNRLEAELLTKNELKDYRGIAFSDYIKFLGIQAEPLIKSLNPIKIVQWFLRFQKQVKQAKKYLQFNSIDIVFGTGGYVSGPVFAACKDLKIPYVIHNLDAFIGIANSVFVADAFALTLGLDSKQKIKPRNGKRIITGNPISKKFLDRLSIVASAKMDVITNPETDAVIASPEGAWQSSPTNDKVNLLITGGSQGAESINSAIGKILPDLAKLNLQITHVTGTKTYDGFVEKYLDGNAKKYSNYTVVPYTHSMPELCSQADLTVCRAGAMTIAEMCISGVVPIFVPLPWAAHDHQNLNAESLVNAGAALSLNQDEKDFEENLFKVILDLVNNPENLNSMRNNLKHFSKPQAAKEIVEILVSKNKFQ